MDNHSTRSTTEGDEITLYTEQEAGTCMVSIETPSGYYIQFNFNPDFPQDAQKFFEALAEIRNIHVEG